MIALDLHLRDLNFYSSLPWEERYIVSCIYTYVYVLSGYYPSGPYYQPAPSALLPQPLPEPCMLPHHLSIKVPHPQVKVLIHNPDTPQDLAAFSEHRSAGKGDPEGVSMMGKITNDNNNNNNNGSIRNNVSKSNGALNHSSQTGNGSKRASEKATEKSSARSEGSKKKEPGDNKKKETESKKKDSYDGKKRENESNKKRDNDSGKNGKNGESSNKKGGESRNKKKEGEGVKKNSHVVLKTKDSKVPKGGPKQPKKKTDKKKKPSEKGEVGAQREETSEVKEESIPEHGWVWVGEPETKKVVSVVSKVNQLPYHLIRCHSVMLVW